MYSFHLFLNQDHGILSLYKGDEKAAHREWQENRNTSQDILAAMESIRAEQKLSWTEIPEFQAELDLLPHSTARRIAETFQKTYTAFVA